MQKRIKALVAGLMIGVGLITAPIASAAEDKTIQIGWTAWADAEFITKLAAKLIEENYGYNVDLVLADIGLQYQGVSTGDLDGMLMAWLPDTHANYWDRVGKDVVDLGPLYEGAKLGWAVPAYTPDTLTAIPDMKKDEVKSKLDDTVQGIDPGAGLMQLSETTIEKYGLEDYNLVSASGAAMTAALARAIEGDEWIVVTLWTPHWAFGRWDLRFLDDPKGTLGAAQHIDAVVRKGFKEDYPEVAGFLTRIDIPLEELQAAMFNAEQTSYEEAVNKYIEEHPDRINQWLGKS